MGSHPVWAGGSTGIAISKNVFYLQNICKIYFSKMQSLLDQFLFSVENCNCAEARVVQENRCSHVFDRRDLRKPEQRMFGRDSSHRNTLLSLSAQSQLLTQINYITQRLTEIASFCGQREETSQHFFVQCVIVGTDQKVDGYYTFNVYVSKLIKMD